MKKIYLILLIFFTLSNQSVKPSNALAGKSVADKSVADKSVDEEKKERNEKLDSYISEIDDTQRLLEDMKMTCIDIKQTLDNTTIELTSQKSMLETNKNQLEETKHQINYSMNIMLGIDDQSAIKILENKKSELEDKRKKAN